MDAKKKRERSLFFDLFIVICLCIPCVIIIFTNAVRSLVRKVSVYIQSEWERFNDIYYVDRHGTEEQTDPALIAHIKGEDSIRGAQCPQKTAENLKGRRLKKTTKQTTKSVYIQRKGQKKKATGKKQKSGLIKIQSPPPPVDELDLKTETPVEEQRKLPQLGQ